MLTPLRRPSLIQFNQSNHCDVLLVCNTIHLTLLQPYFAIPYSWLTPHFMWTRRRRATHEVKEMNKTIQYFPHLADFLRLKSILINFLCHRLVVQLIRDSYNLVCSHDCYTNVKKILFMNFSHHWVTTIVVCVKLCDWFEVVHWRSSSKLMMSKRINSIFLTLRFIKLY